jgi:hypothetical protein
VISSSHRPLPISNRQQNTETKFHACIWIQTRNTTKETHADLHIKPVSYRDRRSQYGILSLHLCWLTNVIERRYVEIVERQKEPFLSSVDWNHPVIISDINVSATISITVAEDYYSQLSSVMWIGELMKVLRLAANNIAECVLAEQQKGWVLWVTVSTA